MAPWKHEPLTLSLLYLVQSRCALIVHGMNGWHLMILKFSNSVVEHILDYLTGVTSRRGGIVMIIVIISFY